MSLLAWLALLPLLLLALLGWELLRLLRAQAPAQIRSRQLGTAAPLSGGAQIPRLIWSYWNSESLPPLIQACADNWRAQAPDHELRFLTPGTVRQWLPAGTDLSLLDSLPPFRQADWLRLPAFLYTGFALVMPPFVSYAQGFEVIQPDRLPRQAKAWSLLADRLTPLELADLPATPEHLRTLTRPPRKGKFRPIGGAPLPGLMAGTA